MKTNAELAQGAVNQISMDSGHLNCALNYRIAEQAITETYAPVFAENAKLKARIAELEHNHRLWFGCPECGEDHVPDIMCPPPEMRTTGQAWFIERIRKAKDRIKELEAALKGL